MITKIILLLSILPILYKLFFWLYTIQLKEYRLDRYKEYLATLQWKQAIFNKINHLEVLFLVLAIINLVAFWNTNQIINYTIVFFLWLYNLLFLYKAFKKKLLKPKSTTRILIIYVLFFIWWWIDLYFLNSDTYLKFSSIYVFLVLVFMPLILFFYNFISLPIVNYKKNKIINSAIKKSKQINNPPIKIAITWSYWKSSVKEFLSSILEQDWETLKTPENINTELWVSAIILNKLSDKYKYFVAEIWAYRIWEIKTLWKIVNHKYWFLTAIWNQHIGLFWNQENIKKGKFEILEKVIENKWFLYVNADNKHIEDYLDKINTTNIIRYWISSDKACAKSRILEIKNLNTKFEFNYNWIQETFETNLIWEHNILNLTWILAFCYDIWLKTEDLKKYLLNIKKPKNTQEIQVIKSRKWKVESELILIDDTYNLSVAWLKSGVDLLKYFNDKQKILVLDDILELWEKAWEIHHNLAKEIAENKQVDKVLYVWVNYEDDFEKGLIDWGFDKENILSTKSFSPLIKSSVILFEGKKAKTILDKFN